MEKFGKPNTIKQYLIFCIDVCIYSFILKLVRYALWEQSVQFSRLFSIDFSYNYQSHFYLFSLGLFPVIFLLYYTVSIYISGGQTPGGFLLKVKISNPENDSLSLYESFYWSLSQLLNFFSFGVLFVINMFTKDSKGLDQYITGLSLMDTKKVLTVDTPNNLYQIDNFKTTETFSDVETSTTDSENKKAA